MAKGSASQAVGLCFLFVLQINSEGFPCRVFRQERVWAPGAFLDSKLIGGPSLRCCISCISLYFISISQLVAVFRSISLVFQWFGDQHCCCALHFSYLASPTLKTQWNTRVKQPPNTQNQWNTNEIQWMSWKICEILMKHDEIHEIQLSCISGPWWLGPIGNLVFHVFH